MKIKLNLVIASLSAFLLVGSTGLAANAASTSLTFANFQASAGYQELQAISTASNAFLADQNGIKFEMSAESTMFGMTQTSSEVFLSTKTASYASVTTPDEFTGDPATINFGFANGSYFEEINSSSLTTVPNGADAIKRLGKAASTNLIHDTAEAPEGFVDISPGFLFSGGSFDIVGLLGVTQDNMTFSEVSKNANQSDATCTDYSYDATMPASGLAPEVTVHASMTFDAANHLKSMRSSANLESVGISSTISATVSVINDLVIEAPTEANSVHMNALVKMGKRISAEKLVTTKAKAVATKAKALAKAAKKTLVAKHIIDAAKALKYKVSSAKNGVKLTATYKSVSGSMCVIATKGAAVVAPC
jgi:hypothetical protein